MSDHMTGLREKMNRHPIAGGAAAVLIALLIIWGVHRSQARSELEPGTAYFTSDDGLTYEVGRVPRPGQGNDKVQAMVFGCSGGGSPFIGYLLRHGTSGDEVKKPGAGNPWVATPPPPATPTANPSQALGVRKAYEAVTRVACPDGGTAVLLMPD